MQPLYYVILATQAETLCPGRVLTFLFNHVGNMFYLVSDLAADLLPRNSISWPAGVDCECID
jgi:hypothetical protein